MRETILWVLSAHMQSFASTLRHCLNSVKECIPYQLVDNAARRADLVQQLLRFVVQRHAHDQRFPVCVTQNHLLARLGFQAKVMEFLIAHAAAQCKDSCEVLPWNAIGEGALASRRVQVHIKGLSAPYSAAWYLCLTHLLLACRQGLCQWVLQM